MPKPHPRLYKSESLEVAWVIFLSFSTDFNVQPDTQTPSLCIKRQDDFQFVLTSDFY